ncbi:MAG: glycosyltransferase [Synergistaceae bacterium]|nr:glycosyltransferase [Synergistaceae bacterium]
MNSPLLSVVIPVYNEEESLPLLFARLMPVLESLNRSYEVVFINDGSRDRSLSMLLECRDRYPGRVVVIDFNGNFGQHMAIMAGFSQARGEMIVTMDADLQNPPEEIPRILEALESGHDVVGTVRSGRRDPLFRKFASKLVNRLSNRITGLKLNDYGCMMRGYNRRIINFINQCKETTTFIPALAQKFAMNPVEIPIAHSEREQGQSKYGLYRLIRLNFDLMTGFSLIPLQAVTMLGMIVSILSLSFGVFLLLRRLIVGPEVEGVFTLMAISFFLMGITLFSVGLVGEYIGRIYQEVRERPRFVIRKVWSHED